MPLPIGDKKPAKPTTIAPTATSKTPERKVTNKKTVASGVKKRTKARKETYSSYIFKVLKQARPHAGISSRAMDILTPSSMTSLKELPPRLPSSLPTTRSPLSRLERYRLREYLFRLIQTLALLTHPSIRLILPGKLGKHAVSEGTVTKYS